MGADSDPNASGLIVTKSTVNPFTSGGGSAWGQNTQSLGSNTHNYTFTGDGNGWDIGISLQSSWAWDSGSWTGPFTSWNVSLGAFAGSYYYSPNNGWVGGAFGFAAGLPFGISRTVTNYTCAAAPK